ncbi:MAG: DUF721 domain-containing protein [Fidelibacterota bacterium]
MKHIKNILDELIKDIGIDKAVLQNRAIVVWEEAVGEKIANIAKPKRIEKGKLWIAVKTPEWRSELQFMKKEIIKNLNRIIGEEVVKDIILR